MQDIARNFHPGRIALERPKGMAMTLGRRRLLALPLVVAAQPQRASAHTTMAVVASFSILDDMVRQIGGERVASRALVGPNSDAHAFQPRPSDAQAIQQAHLLVRNGLGFEPWFDRLRQAAGHSGPTVTVVDGIRLRFLAGHGGQHGVTPAGQDLSPTALADPHAWQDLRLGQIYARNIGAGLALADPDGAEGYRHRTEAYVARLGALDAWVRERVGTVPAGRRKVVTSHDAFGYFGAAYGITFLAPRGILNEAEPSAAAVAQLIRQIRAEGITAVFIENLSNPVVLQRLAVDADVRVQGQLYSDALSASDGPAPTYEAMFRHNVELLAHAMLGRSA